MTPASTYLQYSLGSSKHHHYNRLKAYLQVVMTNDYFPTSTRWVCHWETAESSLGPCGRNLLLFSFFCWKAATGGAGASGSNVCALASWSQSNCNASVADARSVVARVASTHARNNGPNASLPGYWLTSVTMQCLRRFEVIPCICASDFWLLFWAPSARAQWNKLIRSTCILAYLWEGCRANEGCRNPSGPCRRFLD